MSVSVDAAAGDAAQSAHGAGPHVAGAFVERERKDGAMRQSVFRGEGLPFAVFVKAKAVVGACPDAVAIDQNGVDMIVGQAVRSGEVFEAEPRQATCGGANRAVAPFVLMLACGGFRRRSG